jgi:16S rRNA (cytosine967-C5)-methyltransferase
MNTSAKFLCVQVTDEVAGVVRWKRYLDFLILSFFKRDLQDYERMEPLLRQILRVGIYELVKLEMAPHAVLNETVKLAKVALRPGAGNMVNGLLRSVLAYQEMGKLPFPSLEGDDERSRARALATIHSHPVWMVRRWMAQFGEGNTVRLMECNNRRPIFALRCQISCIILLLGKILKLRHGHPSNNDLLH